MTAASELEKEIENYKLLLVAVCYQYGSGPDYSITLSEKNIVTALVHKPMIWRSDEDRAITFYLKEDK